MNSSEKFDLKSLYPLLTIFFAKVFFDSRNLIFSIKSKKSSFLNFNPFILLLIKAPGPPVSETTTGILCAQPSITTFPNGSCLEGQTRISAKFRYSDILFVHS